MSQSKPQLNNAQVKEYDRLMLRSSFASLFWAIITDLKIRRRYRLQSLAVALGVDKSAVSRWFSGHAPNWTLNTISDVANALNVELKVVAVDRATQVIYTPQGKQVEHRLAGDDPFETDEGLVIDIRPLRPQVKINQDRLVHAS